MGGWVIVDKIGSLFLFQIDLIVVNLLFGATAAGEYAIALQWRILLQTIAGTISGVLVPTILTYYAQNQIETLISMTQSAVKFMGLAMALPVGLICGFAPQLLTIWVGAEHANLAPLMVILTIHLAVNTAVMPLFSITIAHNRVRVPGIITIMTGITNLTLAIVVPLVTGWGYYGVAIAGAFIFTIRHVLFVPWYTAKVLGIRMATYTKSLVPGILAVILISGAAIGSIAVMYPYSLLVLTIVGVIITFGYGVIVLKFGLIYPEKKLLVSYLPQNWRRLLKSVDSKRY